MCVAGGITILVFITHKGFRALCPEAAAAAAEFMYAM